MEETQTAQTPPARTQDDPKDQAQLPRHWFQRLEHFNSLCSAKNLEEPGCSELLLIRNLLGTLASPSSAPASSSVTREDEYPERCVVVMAVQWCGGT